MDTSAIVEIAGASDLRHVTFRNRGICPPGFIVGMALSFGLTLEALLHDDEAAVFMSKVPISGDSVHDAMEWYGAQFAELGWSNRERHKCLRHLFVLMVGLGMRESSGRFCEGRDRSASNTTADTAEAGLFQMSWDAHKANPALFSQLMDKWNKKPEQGFRQEFAQGVFCSAKDLENYGSGRGHDFQRLAKLCPAFAVQAAGVGLRCIRRHWGPINRQEAQLKDAANNLFYDIEKIVIPTA